MPAWMGLGVWVQGTVASLFSIHYPTLQGMAQSYNCTTETTVSSEHRVGWGSAGKDRHPEMGAALWRWTGERGPFPSISPIPRL